MRTDYFPTLLAESIAWPAVQARTVLRRRLSEAALSFSDTKSTAALSLRDRHAV